MVFFFAAGAVTSAGLAAACCSAFLSSLQENEKQTMEINSKYFKCIHSIKGLKLHN
jgi:hypothetical protein